MGLENGSRDFDWLSNYFREELFQFEGGDPTVSMHRYDVDSTQTQG